MRKITQAEAVEAFRDLIPGHTVAVHCDRAVITHMKSRFVSCELVPVIGSADLYMMRKKRPDVRDQVMKLCAEVGFYFTRVDVDVRVTYLRTLVSEYNREHGTRIRVTNRGGQLYLIEDLNERETITRSEYEALKARCDEMLQVGRLMLKDEPEAVEIQDEPVPEVEAVEAPQPKPDTIEGPKPRISALVADAAAMNAPRSIEHCFECGDEILIYPGESKICDTCRGVG